MTTQAFATEGINLIGVGPIQQGTGGAGVASAKDSTWVILNPAGLVDLEPGVDASLQIFAPVRTLNSTLTPAGEQEDDSMFVIPSISTSFGCCGSDNSFIGLGIDGTSGMGVDYGGGGVGFGTMTEVSVAKMTATYAYRFGDSGLSIGAGPVFVVSGLRTDMMGMSGDWDIAYGAGAIVGVNQRLGAFSIGASYITEQYVSEWDDYDDLMPESLNLPQQFTVGVAVDVLDNVELAIDYRWLGWSNLDTLGDQWGWDDQHIVKAGVTWCVNEALTLRGGVSYGKSPIDEETAMGNALFPAIIETHLACGASYALKENLKLHLAYIHALENDITANGSDIGMGAGTEISMYQNSLTAGVTYRF